jgi:hypothetical protein
VDVISNKSTLVIKIGEKKYVYNPNRGGRFGLISKNIIKNILKYKNNMKNNIKNVFIIPTEVEILE